MADLKPGFRVRLRSGGPLMTVRSIHGDNIDCQWFTIQGEIQSATFPIFMLMVIEGAADAAASQQG